jgi:hypothetical protein
MSWHVLLAAIVLWLRKNTDSCGSHTLVLGKREMYKGKCAVCGAVWNSKAFKSRPAGYDLPVASKCCLSFVFQSATNNKICGSCNQKNIWLMKRDRDEKEDQKIEEAKMARLDENDANVNDMEELEVLEMAEKEGTAISALLYLSNL